MPPKVPRPPFDPEAPFVRELPLMLNRRLRAMTRHRNGAIAGTDPEELHELRVNALRLEAALRVFRPALTRGSRKHASRLKNLLRRMGAVREYDVFLRSLDDAREECPQRDIRALHLVRTLLESERERKQQKLAKALTEGTFEKEFARFVRVKRKAPKR